jgi:heterodisulfide reductase subunit A-like polyferredoxin
MSESTGIMEIGEDDRKVGLIFCVCTGKCPGFKDLDFWDFINVVRSTYPVKYAFIHPMLCDEDGERFFKEHLRPGRKYLITGCAPIMQRKLFKDSFKEAGLDVEKDLIALDIRNMSTEKALELVKKTLDEVK